MKRILILSFISVSFVNPKQKESEWEVVYQDDFVTIEHHKSIPDVIDRSEIEDKFNLKAINNYINWEINK